MASALAGKTCTPCRGGVLPLTPEEAEGYRAQAPDWSLMDEATRIERRFRFKDFRAAFAFVARAAELAEAEGHHPDGIWAGAPSPRAVGPSSPVPFAPLRRPLPACKLGRAVPQEGIMRLISGGQTGAARAALDLAMELGIDHGGWVPKGRAAEDGPLPNRYRVRETPSEDRAERTKRNVEDSDATLLISHGPLTGGSELTRRHAAELGKPVLHVELGKLGAPEAADRIARWLGALGCRTLNVAGPRASEEAGIYAAASAVLRRALSEHLGRHREDGPGAAFAQAANR